MRYSIRQCGPVSGDGIATGYRLDGPGIESRWARDFPHLSSPAPGAHSASCTMSTGSFPGVKCGRSVTMTPHPLLVSWSRKSRAIPLLSLWAVRPVQSLSACTRVHFTFVFTLLMRQWYQVRFGLDEGEIVQTILVTFEKRHFDISHTLIKAGNYLYSEARLKNFEVTASRRTQREKLDCKTIIKQQKIHHVHRT